MAYSVLAAVWCWGPSMAPTYANSPVGSARPVVVFWGGGGVLRCLGLAAVLTMVFATRDCSRRGHLWAILLMRSLRVAAGKTWSAPSSAAGRRGQHEDKGFLIALSPPGGGSGGACLVFPPDLPGRGEKRKGRRPERHHGLYASPPVPPPFTEEAYDGEDGEHPPGVQGGGRLCPRVGTAGYAGPMTLWGVTNDGQVSGVRCGESRGEPSAWAGAADRRLLPCSSSWAATG